MPRIKELPAESRPRERLIYDGSETLSDVELLAVLIGTGTAKKSALGLAREVYDRFGGLRGIAGRNLSELMAIEGIGEAKAAVVAACYEIATRIVELVAADWELELREMQRAGLEASAEASAEARSRRDG